MGAGLAPLYPTILPRETCGIQDCLLQVLGPWGKLAGPPHSQDEHLSEDLESGLLVPLLNRPSLTFNPLALFIARSGLSTLRTLKIFTTEIALDLQEASCCGA